MLNSLEKACINMNLLELCNFLASESASDDEEKREEPTTISSGLAVEADEVYPRIIGLVYIMAISS